MRLAHSVVASCWLPLLIWMSRSDALPRPQFEQEDNEVSTNCGGDNGAPLITPCKESIKLEYRTNYTLRCEASEPIIWWASHESSLVSSFDNTEEDPQRPYGLQLHLIEVTADNVGAYYCIKESSAESLTSGPDEKLGEMLGEMVNNDLASTIYVFVNDPINLLVPTAPIVHARQYTDVVIPCKPSMPETEVLLTFNSDKFSSQTSGRYDPKRGFTIEIRSITDGGDYYCEPEYPAAENEEEYTVIPVRFIGNGHIDTSGLDSASTSSATILPPNIEYGVEEYNGVTTPEGSADSDNDNDNDDDFLTTVTNTTNGNVALSSGAGLGRNKSESEDRSKLYPLRRKRSPVRLLAAPLSPSPSPNLGQANDRLNKPSISSTPGKHVIVNGTFTLVCELSAPQGVNYEMSWSTPNSKKKWTLHEDAYHLDPQGRISYTKPRFDNTMKNSTHVVGSSRLTVTQAQESDEGTYKCTVTDSFDRLQFTTYKMKVMQPNTTYLDVREPAGHYNVNEFANRTITMTAEFSGFPQPIFKWYRPDGSEFWETGHNFNIESTESSTTLRLHNVQLKDSGTYVLKGKVPESNVTRVLKYNVSVMSSPELSMDDVYVEAGNEAHLDCLVRSYPPAVVTFLFRPCKLVPRWPTCNSLNQNFSSPDVQKTFKFNVQPRPGLLSVERIYAVSFTPTEPGILSCAAQNLVDGVPRMAITKSHVLIGNIAEKMTIYGLDENRKIAKGDEESFTCEALAYHFDGTLTWYHNGEEVEASEALLIQTSHSDYSYKSTLKFPAMGDGDRGTYECRAHHIHNHTQYDSREIDVYVHDPKAPHWVHTNLNANSKMEKKLGESLALECRSMAVPKAKVRWFKDGKELQETNLTHIIEDEEKLLITHLYPYDDGIYRCLVENRLGSIENSITVVIADMPGINKAWIWFGVMLFLILISLCAFLAVRYHKERKRHLALKAAGLANFEEGAVEHINPSLSLDEQADLLPYDQKFEFARESLKLGKQLGAGAFGVVLKGEAKGIRTDEPTSTVAVKMVKRTADNEVVRALVSELKIMVHLGQHLNVVNLLGAVTKNIAKRELMVIVEYCRFGNVQNFLLRNRKFFINQISPVNDRIDPAIMVQRVSETFELHRNSDNDPRSGTRAGRPGSAGYSYDRQTDTCATEATVMTTVPEDEHVMSNNSIQPAWRSNYKTDSTEAMTVTTTDLVSWAFQVARGMDYLSSKKVLHGDLAARNILLCEDNVVKICDFGLARSMYRGENYKKSESGKLPIKWLALESLSDHVFSTYSDVWSFGIVLWELFSLAKVPYPGIDPNQELFNKLNDGYRMEKPPYANQEIYEIMLECWRKNPESRPLFAELEKRFATMLGEDVTNHYLDLNNPYMQTNMEYMKSQSTDYLALMGSPDEPAPAAPRYVNGHIVPDIRIEELPDDYQAMSPPDTSTAIYSPTRLDGDDMAPTANFTEFADFSPLQTTDTSFTFPDATPPQPQRLVGQHSPTLSNNMNSSVHKPLRKKNGLPTVDTADQAPEEIPMLHRTSTSDTEQSPEQGRRFNQALKQQYVTPKPSPRHHVETKLNGESENYVNVKPPRKNLVNKPTTTGGTSNTEAFSNPSYQPLSGVNEKVDRRY
ncbi:platelet-derived growth factor receptor alpha isoform X5 [Drosophila pseudoobscura]|uniref:receptor protein-tyrosine kinase n=1 Tax=Drosophila pseudoobscura pseudoobscura TaxID=46245 RepID=A0A6I8V9I6_DROPS|nr:platelet-derived growth factor receptor alpha isoform X5 [Drosophila pseudoobscura]